MKFLSLALLVALALPVASHAGAPTSCGTRLANGEEIMFELPDVDYASEMVQVTVGKPYAFRDTTVTVKKYKVSGGLIGGKIVSLRDGNRFDLRYKQTLLSKSDFRLTANIPELGLRVVDVEIDCLTAW